VNTSVNLVSLEIQIYQTNLNLNFYINQTYHYVITKL